MISASEDDRRIGFASYVWRPYTCDAPVDAFGMVDGEHALLHAAIRDLNRLRLLIRPSDMIEAARQMMAEARGPRALDRARGALYLIGSFRAQPFIDWAGKVCTIGASTAMTHRSFVVAQWFLKYKSSVADLTSEDRDMMVKAKQATLDEESQFPTDLEPSNLGELCQRVDSLAWWPTPRRLAFAQRIVENVPEADHKKTEVLIARASLLFALGEIENAADLLASADISRPPIKWEALVGRSEVPEPIRIADSCAPERNDSEQMVNLAYSCIACSLYHDATHWFNQTLKICPADPVALHGRGLILWRFGHFRAARTLFEAVHSALRSQCKPRIIAFSRIDPGTTPRSLRVEPEGYGQVPALDPEFCSTLAGEFHPFAPQYLFP